MASLLVLLSLAAGAKAEDGAPLRIGLLIPFSGALADFGPPHHNAAELAAMHVNNAGGVLGQDIEVVVGDTGTEPSQGVLEALRLIEDEGVSAVVGALSSSVTLAVAGNATVPNGVLQISAGSTSTELTTFEDNDLLFRTALPDAAQGRVLAALARELGYETASTLYVNHSWGQSLSDVFASEFQGLDGEILATVPHEEWQDTYVDELVEATAGSPEVLAAISWPQSATVYLDEAIANGLIDEFLFVDGTKSQEMFDALGAEQFNGMYGTATGAVDSPAKDAFDAAYEAEYGEPPPVAFMREAYDAVALIALAAEAAGSTDPEDIRDALRGIANPPGEIVGLGASGIGNALEQVRLGNDVDYEGASGTVDVDANGDICGGAVEIWRVEDGQIRTVRMEPVHFCTLGALIDIKPDSDDNCVNPRSQGGIPVAILTTADFDASTVDPFTVELHGGSVRLNGKSGNAGALEDVDGDGDLDLVVQIIDWSVMKGQTEAILTGQTFDGTDIQGADSICVVPPSDVVDVLGTLEEVQLQAMVDPWELATGDTADYTGISDTDFSDALETLLQEDDPPDVAIVPGPSAVRQFGFQEQLKRLSDCEGFEETIAAEHPQDFIDELGTVDGELYGLPLGAYPKGTIWYNPQFFDANGYEPQTADASFDDLLALTGQIRDDGVVPPWSIGLESDPPESSGWPGTDWIQEILLNEPGGVDAYDGLIEGSVPFTHPLVKEAWEKFGEIALNPANTVQGGPAGINATFFIDSIYPPFERPDPGAAMVLMGAWARNIIPGVPGEDFDFFPWPGRAVTGNPSHIVVAFNDDPTTCSFLDWLASAEAQEIGVGMGGFISVNTGVDLDSYPDPVSSAIAEQLTTAEVFRFDLDDAIGGDMQLAFFAGVVDYLTDLGNLDAILAEIEAARE